MCGNKNRYGDKHIYTNILPDRLRGKFLATSNGEHGGRKKKKMMMGKLEDRKD